MLDLIDILTALSIYCQDAHYAFTGINFNPLHEWADDIREPLDGFIDEIKESYLLRNGIVIPRQTQINARAADYVPTALGDNEQIIDNIYALLTMANKTIDNQAKLDALTQGDADLIGRISSHLQKHLGLIGLAIKQKPRAE